MKPIIRFSFLIILFGIGLNLTRAQDVKIPISGFRAEFLRQWDDLEKKMISLAEAVPQEKYSWRPGEGVRSIAEVYAHVAGGNFGYPVMLGIQPPVGIDRENIEKISDKAKILELLKLSFQHVRQALLNTPDTDLDKPVKIGKRDGTAREVFFIIATHQPEHLGQSISYARMNGVVPPWTAERESKKQPSEKK